MSYEQIAQQHVKEDVSKQAQVTYENYDKIKSFKDVGYLLAYYVVSGGEVIKNVLYNNAIDAADIVVSLDNNILGRDGHTFITEISNTTYYLDFDKSGDWYWGLSHIGTAGVDYLPIASVTTNSSGLVNIITDLRGYVGGTRFKDEYGLDDYAKKAQLEETDEKVNSLLADKQLSPVQHYGFSQVYVPFPDTEYSVTSDITFADDRDGHTGKLWAFYFDSLLGHVKREVPYIGCKSSELGTPIQINTSGGQLNHIVKIDGIWYVSTGPYVWGFLNGLDQDAIQLSIISQVGENGDQAFLFNSCIDKHSNGTWYAWYSTFNGTAVGIRRATAPAPTGPWTIQSDFWLTGDEIHSSLNWLRVYYVFKDKWGRNWAVAGAGRKWGGVGWPDNDDAASVWISPVWDITTKPTQWTCVADLPYFQALPYGSPAINNAYAPTFLQDGDNWYLYINSGRYGKEQIVELRPNMSQSWQNQQNEAADYYLGAVLYPIEWSRAFLRGGTFKVTLSGQLLSYYESAQLHSVFLRMKDASSDDIYAESLLQNGAEPWESRQFSISTIVNVDDNLPKLIVVEAMYSVGDGQVTPAEFTSRLRAVALSIEKIN